ncbi:MAG: dihydropyrimidinase [Bacteroidales bacterium]|nr:dihydropyrimidinase [Bacteroidales bacterium]
MELLIKNGIIINANNSFEADILCKNGKINKIEKKLKPKSKPDIIVDATDCYVFPGGIDPHVHMHLPTPAGFSSDDFLSGSKAALFGGTTTIIDFVTPKIGQSLPEALSERKKEASNSIIDYSFHVSPVEWTKTSKQEIKSIIKDKGINSFKIYMAYKDTIGLDDEDILKVMKAVGKAGGIVTSHCELGDDIKKLKNSFAENGNLSPEFHPKSRPAEMESKAVKRAIELAKIADCPLYIVHVSAKESLKYIKRAQKDGQKVFAETCPQYLLLNDLKYKGEFHKTAPFVLSPPLRKQEDNEALWEAIIDRTIQTIGTDHCPFMLKQKEFGLNDFNRIPSGVGGVEHRLALLFTFGVLTNRITLNRFVEIISTQAAKIFGLYPAKGEITENSDADLIIWNPEKENIISAKTHHQNCDTNIFENIKTKGAVKYLIKNGEIVIQDGELLKEIKGSFLKR